MQTFPSVVFGLFTRWFRAPGLLAGWAVGFFGGSFIAWGDGLKPLHAVSFGGATYTIYAGLLALAANVIVAVLVNLVPAGRSAPAVAR